jgi:hypothetical protein
MNFPQFGIMSGASHQVRTGASGFLFRHFSLCFLHEACVTSIYHGIDYFFRIPIRGYIIITFFIQGQNLQDFSYWQSGLGKSKFHIKLTSKYSVSHVSEFQINRVAKYFFFWKRVKVNSEVRRHRKSATRDYDRGKTNKQSKLF